ncbi:MAG: lyase family protein [Patescibacteria group bacterium]
MTSRNLTLPGLPRYQPRMLKEVFGYDNLVLPQIEVEWAVLETFAEIGFMSTAEAELLTPQMKAFLCERITTTLVEDLERRVTEHDIRALVQLMQERMPIPLRKYVHLSLTSYDVVATADMLRYKQAHQALRPHIYAVLKQLGRVTREYAHAVQMGRTHGQYAVPITFGFWLGALIERFLWCATQLDCAISELRGKISGAVGAYNAQVAMGIVARAGSPSFEARVLSRLGLRSAVVSTQIVPPEPLAHYLQSAVLLSSVVGQLGRDCRHLMRPEIGEISEGFSKGQVGSSTMAHKRNPKTFEQLEGMAILAQSEYSKVLATLISEHQRDLVGSSIARTFPLILIYLAQQLETLLREKNGLSFIERIKFGTSCAGEKVRQEGRATLAELLYCALQYAGYPKDAHMLVSEKIAPLLHSGMRPVHAVHAVAVSEKDDALQEAWTRIPREAREILESGNAALYTGRAAEIAVTASVRAEAASAVALGTTKAR